MNECIFKIKQQKFRERIRKTKIEEMFRLKRNMASFCTYSCKLHQVYLNFSNNLEMQSQITIQCDQAMQELISKNNTHDSLLLLANLCASSNLGNIKKLVEKFKLHQIFIEILQQTNSYSWQIEYALQGLMNLLISDFNSQQILIMLLDSNLITIIIKIKQKIDDKLEISKETLLKLILGVLCQISYLNCENHITKPQLIDLFTININWFSECQEYSCLNIIIICEYLEGLLGLISEAKFLELLNLVKITYQTTRNLTLRMLIMINKLMSSFDANCNNCSKLIKESTIFEFFSMAFQKNEQIDELLIEHCFLFLNDILSLNSSELLPECLELLQPFLQLTEYIESLTILMLCSQTLTYLVDKQTIFQSNYSEIIKAQFNVLRKLSNEQQVEGTLMVLESLLKLCDQNSKPFNQEQIEFLEKLKQNDNQDIREVLASILQYEFI